MSFLSGKRILLGITAGIAAYKTASLVRLFIKCGAEVKVVMTPSAKDFITPLTLSTLSKNPVYSSFTSEEDENEVWNNHVELGLWADFFVIAPATANTLAKMANGICDNLLMATYLSAKCPIYFAPAMDLDMYKHESTKTSIERLQEFGNILIPPGTGELASGLVGEGRMAEPEEIVEFIENSISSNLPLNGITVLITAGPTYEAIDPVRFIGNHSSGKMGYAIAEAAIKFGARVILISGPTSETLIHKNLTIVNVMSSEEMYQNVHKYFGESDIAILSAAVADYRPKTVSNQKIKKQDSTFSIELVKTKDILASLGEIKKEKFLVGFALETENELYNAKKKLANKNLDLIVLNSLNDDGAGFGTLTNKVTFITAQGDVFEEGLKSKMEVAEDLIKLIVTSYVK
ncbi:bifunctional phosphopantothenoylcysteine decarboxylase/phosphopantothenate--cysteine ligase CoaBC [Aegicerativicinus sediminis]